MMILGLSDSSGNGMLTVLLVLCATVIMVVLLRRHQFRSVTRRDVAREQLARIRDQHRLRDSMDELLVQLEEASRTVGAQLDTKFAKLENVIRDADDRIARLEHVLGRVEGSAGPPGLAPGDPATLGPDRGRPARAPTLAEEPRASPAGEPRASARAAGNEGAPTAGEGAPATDPSPSGGPAEPRFARVYELVDAGATPIQAAEQLDLPLGEVELILNLRKLR